MSTYISAKDTSSLHSAINNREEARFSRVTPPAACDASASTRYAPLQGPSQPPPYDMHEFATTYNSLGSNHTPSGAEHQHSSSSSSIPRSLTSPSHYPRQPYTIAIPQIALPSSLSHPPPFLRAHAPTLSSHHCISQAEFLAIIDQLNICMAHAAPFKAMSVAAAGLEMLPEPVTQGVSAGLDVAAGVGNEVTIWWRVRKLLEQVNAEVWAPRGLEMKVVKDRELLPMLGLDSYTQLKELENTSTNSVLEALTLRRYRTFLPHVAELDFNIPPVVTTKESNFVDKLSVKDQARRAQKKQSKLRKRQLEADERAKLRPLRGTSALNFMVEDDVLSNATALDDSTSDSESGSDDDSSISRMLKHTTKADAKAEKINSRYECKIQSDLSPEKAAKIGKERDKELDRVEKEWKSRRETFEKARHKKNEKRTKKNGKRMEKAGKKIEKLSWVVVVERTSS